MKGKYFDWSIRVKTRVLLLFNAIGAVYGGSSLMMHRDGSGLGMTTELLKNSPFPDFFVPGLILLLVNGLLSSYCVFLTFRHYRFTGKMVMLQGILLAGWILVQIRMINAVDILHYVMGGTGLSLIILGIMAQKRGTFSDTGKMPLHANINHNRG